MEYILEEIKIHKITIDILNKKYFESTNINEKNLINNDIQNEQKLLIALYDIYNHDMKNKQEKKENNNEIPKTKIKDKKKVIINDEISSNESSKSNNINNNQIKKVKKRNYTYEKKMNKNENHIKVENVDPKKDNNFQYYFKNLDLNTKYYISLRNVNDIYYYKK